ncbi:hypothetical protein PMM47T1_14130 [Pseudomonas sp. M47T1]|uniref:hypothetical protein n=1 Tax=Pseudomonas sp. M47T1 TaxID=1179778 RepID=UPI0002608846|nr:hypothetical protein [Pseudomonas sp. M47T1]EIK96104.1 hypothetical protein PMM47T1_14130 [Pseudomonas sp. M47T1]
MSDRELLELAAKAAGLETGHPMNAERLALDPPVDSLLVMRFGELVSTAWNPLKDDGHALRLASHLGLNIEWFINQQFVMVRRGEIGENIGWVDDALRHGALRKAITVVAAEIGRAMP